MARSHKRQATRTGPLHIALAFPLSQAHLQTLARGITDFARTQSRWLLTTGGESATLSIEQLHGWRGDGIVAALVRPSEVQAARHFMRRGVPVVTIAGAIRRQSGIPRVTVENQAVGRLAATHLLSCGFQRFAFYGLRDVAYSTERHQGFVDGLRAAGHDCTSYWSPHTFGRRRPWQDEVLSVQQWLTRLQAPVGVFAVNDYRARLVVDACELAGLRSPEQVGIVGVDNDKVMCEFTEPQLSSIECDWYRVGQEAGRILQSLMRGEGPAATELLVPPRGVVARASTHVTIVEHPALLLAVNYVRDHLHEIFGVERLLEVSGVSRRKLEQAFQAELGMSPYQYLCSKRIEKAKGLLQIQPPLKLSEISRQCGFHDQRRFRLVFCRLEKISPAEFRKDRSVAMQG
ncbi:MAG TPA: XylR family transcriptional regulator [Phycisphaerae bacterium]|jgi:LacI family transcriptional regulator|nr:XylR family transcriptional regulator [Phycisphaerae bacterium]